MEIKWRIPYQGKTWVFDEARLTGSEARLQKQLTGGLTPNAADAARLERDGDAFTAALAIARKRDGVPVAEAVMVDPDGFDVNDIVRATEAAYAAERAPEPVGGVPGDEIVRTVELDDAEPVAPKTRARKTAQ